MSTVPQALFTGSTEECFEHYMQSQPFWSGQLLIVEFCSIDLNKLQLWLSDFTKVRGEEKLRLRCMLLSLGYQVTELYELSEPARDVALMMGMRVISPATVNAALGYTNEENQSVWRIFLHGGGMSSVVVDAVNQLAKKYRAELTLAKQSWDDRISQIIGGHSAEADILESAPHMLIDPSITAAAATLAPTLSSLLLAVINGNAVEDLIRQTTAGSSLAELRHVLEKILPE